MFPAEALTFLRGLARNNDREWFQPRKETFETKVKAPMLVLIEEINAELMDFAPEHVTNPKNSIYRIYRDTRFSADKTPYKTHVAAIFPHKTLGKHTGAGFYFHISPKHVGIAAGMYGPGPEELLAVRTFLTDRHEELREACKAPAKLMGKLHGDSVTRMPKGFDAESPAADLIRMKQWMFWTELDVKTATSPKLRSEIVRRFRAAAPMVNLLNSSLQRNVKKKLVHPEAMLD
jgi:uncharacterized protein (TIGR02453 family)